MNSEKETQMQDEELYALLDSVMEDERLTVREDLIQATLQRAKEEAGVIPVKKSGRKVYRILSYAGMAAAAVLVLFVGIKTGSNGGFTGNSPKAESVADGLLYERGDGMLTADRIESEQAGGKNGSETNMYFPTADDADGTELQEPMEAAPDAAVPEWEKADITDRSEAVAYSCRVKIAEEFRDALSGTEYEPTENAAECWMFGQRQENWQEELRKAIEACIVEKGLPEEGDYAYTLTCEDGSLRGITATAPLDLIVRIQTESGELWGLFGETVRVYRVN